MMRSLRRGAALLVVAVATATPVTAQDDDEVRAFSPPAALEPGRYATDRVPPGFTFVADDGWTSTGIAPGDLIELYQNEEAGLWISGFTGEAWDQPCHIVGSEASYSDYVLSATDIGKSAEALISHIQQNPYIEAQEPVSVEVDGYRGLQLDFVATPGPRCTDNETTLFVASPLDDAPDGSWPLFFLTAGEWPERLIAVDVDDVVVVAWITAPEDQFEALLDLAMPLIESMEFSTEGAD